MPGAISAPAMFAPSATGIATALNRLAEEKGTSADPRVLRDHSDEAQAALKDHLDPNASKHHWDAPAVLVSRRVVQHTTAGEERIARPGDRMALQLFTVESMPFAET